MEQSQNKTDSTTKNIIEINDTEVRGHLRELVRGSVEEDPQRPARRRGRRPVWGETLRTQPRGSG